MKMDNVILKKIFSWIVVLLVPIVLVLTAVRLVLAPWFIQFEYRTPNFPDDSFGFTLDERLTYANYARLYLLNNSDINYLGELHFPEGEQAPPQSCEFMDDCTSLFNQRELKHMEDVKNVVKVALKIWIVSLGLLLIIGIWAWYRKGIWLSIFRDAVAKGGWLTVILVGVIVIFFLAAFGIAFVIFHEIFFQSGTWRFLYSDTLIRLFPERFWRDTFLIVGVLAVVPGVLLGYFLPRLHIAGQNTNRSTES